MPARIADHAPPAPTPPPWDMAPAFDLLRKERFTEALDQKPSKPLLAMAYRGLGIAYVYAGDAKRGVQYFKLYLPFCPDAERQQLDQTIARYCGV